MVDAQTGNFLSDLAVNASFHWNRACYTFTDGGLTFPVPNEKFQLVTVPRPTLELELDTWQSPDNEPDGSDDPANEQDNPPCLTEADLLAIAITELEEKPDDLIL